jgi:hypothetical protein
MPRVTIRTGIVGPDGREETLSDYLCDWPGCPNIATQVLACVRELSASVVVCDEHAAPPRTRPDSK